MSVAVLSSSGLGLQLSRLTRPSSAAVGAGKLWGAGSPQSWSHLVCPTALGDRVTSSPPVRFPWRAFPDSVICPSSSSRPPLGHDAAQEAEFLPPSLRPACHPSEHLPGTLLERASSQSHKGRTWAHKEQIRFVPASPLLPGSPPYSSHSPQGWQRPLWSIFSFVICSQSKTPEL